jgi:hypothetical protein
VLLPNPPGGPVALKVLNNYKAAVLIGAVKIDDGMAKRLMEYVEQGGTLLINSKQVNKYIPSSFLGAEVNAEVDSVGSEVISLINNERFTLPDEYECNKINIKEAKPILIDNKTNALACLNKYGKGQVILTAVDYLMPKANLESIKKVGEPKLPFISFLLKQLVKEALPLEVIGDIEYGLNKLEDGWLVYLINNKGVYKFAKTPQRLNPEETASVEVVLRDIKPEEIAELREEKQINFNKETKSFRVDVKPGDISIIKITTKKEDH